MTAEDEEVFFCNLRVSAVKNALFGFIREFREERSALRVPVSREI
jgi:hypothetical protein